MLAALTRPFKIWIARATIANLEAMQEETSYGTPEWRANESQLHDWQGYLGELRRQPGLWNTIKGKL